MRGEGTDDWQQAANDWQQAAGRRQKGTTTDGQQAANDWQQAAGSRQQGRTTTDGQQAANDWQQAAGSREQGTVALSPEPRNPAPYTLLPAPDTLRPAPSTRHPSPDTRPPAPVPQYLLVFQGVAIIMAGILCSAGYYLSPAVSNVMLFFLSGRESAYLWAGPASVVLGLGYARLVRSLSPEPPSSGFNRSAAIFIGAFLATIVALIAATQETLQFFILLFYLFPCSILTCGIVAGRLWAVMLGVVLNMLIGLASPSGPDRSFGELIGFAALFLASAELAYSSTAYKALWDREMAEVRTETGRQYIASTLWFAIKSYWSRLALTIFSSSVAVAAALAIYNDPGLFGAAYGGSFVAQQLTAFLLPAIMFLGIMSAGLLLRRDLPARVWRAVCRLRSYLRTSSAPSR